MDCYCKSPSMTCPLARVSYTAPKEMMTNHVLLRSSHNILQCRKCQRMSTHETPSLPSMTTSTLSHIGFRYRDSRTYLFACCQLFIIYTYTIASICPTMCGRPVVLYWSFSCLRINSSQQEQHTLLGKIEYPNIFGCGLTTNHSETCEWCLDRLMIV